MSDGAVLILSGGVSRRMGQAKALLPITPEADLTFLGRLEMLTENVATCRVVVSSLSLPTELSIVHQPEPERGQLSSILLGWAALAPKPKWVMICLVDHPYVHQSTIDTLVSAVFHHPDALMWSPSYQRRGGHPVIFSAEMMERLQSNSLEEGARPVVRSLGARRHWVEVDDPAVLWDTDTPKDYERHSGLFLTACS